MFITNPEILDKSKVYCCDNKIKDYLVKNGVPYLSRKTDDNGYDIWIFRKTNELLYLLHDYKR